MYIPIIPISLLCIFVPILTPFMFSDLRFLWGSVYATWHIHSYGTLPGNLVPLAFLQFSLLCKYLSITLLYFSLNINLDKLLLTLTFFSLCLTFSCLFETNPSYPWCPGFAHSLLFTVLITVWAIPLLWRSNLTSSNLWDPNCNKGIAHKQRPSPMSKWTLSFWSFGQESYTRS